VQYLNNFNTMSWGQLSPSAQSLELSPTLRDGLCAIAALSVIALCSSTLLFVYLVHRLVSWRFGAPPHDNDNHVRRQEDASSVQKATADAVLGIDGMFARDDGHPGKPQHNNDNNNNNNNNKRVTGAPNQFIILLCNLMLADMHQGLSFLLVTIWLRADKIDVDTTACFVQGMFISIGDLASSMFITLIAVHTYISVVGEKKIPQRALYLAVLGVWVFVYAMATVPIGATQNGASQGGFFARAGAWVSFVYTLCSCPQKNEENARDGLDNTC
jgi:hypothetical protein